GGGAGTISATANVNPAAIHKLYAEWRSAGADQQQQLLNVVRETLGKKYVMIAALKQTIALYANDPAWAKGRPPLLELSAAQVNSLTAELQQIGFAMPGLPKISAAAE